MPNANTAAIDSKMFSLKRSLKYYHAMPSPQHASFIVNIGNAHTHNNRWFGLIFHLPLMRHPKRGRMRHIETSLIAEGTHYLRKQRAYKHRYHATCCYLREQFHSESDRSHATAEELPPRNKSQLCASTNLSSSSQQTPENTLRDGGTSAHCINAHRSWL